MRRQWLAVTALLVVAAGGGNAVLAGCAEDKVPPGDVPTTGAAPAPVLLPPSQAPASVAAAPAEKSTKKTEPAKAAEPDLDGFVAAVRRELPDAAVDRRDDEVADLAEQECESLEQGKSHSAIVTETTELGGVGKTQAATMIKLAITAVCPAQEDRAAEF
jgi:hypothetical protein